MDSNFSKYCRCSNQHSPLFDGMDVTSDIHFEINALALVCRSSQSTEGCTAYIPIHPCKRCFAALVTFGIRRIVCRRESTLLNCQTAAARNIEVSHLSYQQQRCQMKRIYQLVNDERTDEQLMELLRHVAHVVLVVLFCEVKKNRVVPWLELGLVTSK
jgi:deoxycytidylate deaminase